MTTKTNSYFIHVMTDPDYWGSNTDDFDCVAEAERIRKAAEDAGVAVAFDEDRREVIEYGDNGEQLNSEIDWFNEWCTAGHEWSDSQWVQWFSQFSR